MRIIIISHHILSHNLFLLYSLHILFIYYFLEFYMGCSGSKRARRENDALDDSMHGEPFVEGLSSSPIVLDVDSNDTEETSEFQNIKVKNKKT